jgi:hypothetical protein
MSHCTVTRFVQRRSQFLTALFALLIGLVTTSLVAQEQKANTFPQGKLTDPAGTPRDYRSQWFFLHTDLSGKEAKDLLDRLEKMLALVSRYWGKPPQKMIETYVIKEMKNWPAGSLDPDGKAMVDAGGGLTLSRGFLLSGDQNDPDKPRKMRDVTAVCYCGADHGTPQHEAVHAYCAQTFGTTGPVWYSEGMAEMGQYFRDGENRDVKIHPGVVEYLRKEAQENIKSLNGIVNNKEKTGDSWQNYAWRWALCHLLANNPNYASRFRPLGLDILTTQQLSFEKTYGDQADRISFEYKFFINHLCNGFRCDLASFDWAKKFLPLQGSIPRNVSVLADRGWQPSQATVSTDKTYEFTTSGSWQLAKGGDNIGPAGTSDGKGKLIGVIMKDFELGEPFDLGANGEWTPPENGNLWVRCRDDWAELGDNKGKVTLTLKLKK